MDVVDFFLYLSLSLIFIAFILQIFSYFLFKNNVHKYDELISEFRSRNLDLDIMTNIYSFFGSLFNANKIVYFVDLYNGRKMKLAKGKQISKQTYHFILSQPQGKISWMLKLHVLNVISFCFLFFGVAIGLTFCFV
ncbi:hypothetical protein HA48_18830 [Pantoea wallisii]|uniref:Uncharacterized protein n=1 Tax=Pantoea wallisii TaxID=1076551 RepID=A0A1X1CZ47_9GAMM|nr:hypothetical protein [Pantoea wallisii]ORM69719.1 hypothetical protein HA48_18830 [Pantoea wallisii]